MASSNLLPNVRPAELLRESIFRHIRYTLVRSPGTQARRTLSPVSLAVRDRIVDRMLETESRYRHKDAKAPLLPLHGIPHGPLAGRQPVEPARRGTVPRGAGRLRRQPGRGAGQREPMPGWATAAWAVWPPASSNRWPRSACPASATASTTSTASSGRRSSTASSARSPIAGRPTALPSRSSTPKKPSPSRCTAASKDRRDVERQPAARAGSTRRSSSAFPTDMPIVGYLGQTVNWLRLFTARASEDFDIEIFNRGDYIRAVEQKIAVGKHLARALSRPTRS